MAAESVARYRTGAALTKPAVTTADVEDWLILFGGLATAENQLRPSSWGPATWLRVLARLTFRQRRVLLYTMLHGMSERRIAKDWGISRARVWAIRVAALKNLDRFEPELLERLRREL